MRKILVIFCAVVLLWACSESEEQKLHISKEQKLAMAREDSAALKIAVLPTLDCMPLFVAKELHLFDTLKCDIRLKEYNGQITAEDALRKGQVEGMVTDLIRGERMKQKGFALTYKIATGQYWQLITNRNARIRELKQLDDKMIAMARFSATHAIASKAADSAKIPAERVFFIQINNVPLRLNMLENNQMDALVLPEPQSSIARMNRNRVLLDTRKLDMQMGVVAFATNAVKTLERKKQVDAFVKGYNAACDSINKNGLGHYSQLLVRYCKVKEQYADSVTADFKFTHAQGPREKDIQAAEKWNNNL